MPFHYQSGLPPSNWLAQQYTAMGGTGGVRNLGARPSRYGSSGYFVAATNLANTNVGSGTRVTYTGPGNLGSFRPNMAFGSIGPVLAGVGKAACAGLDPTWKPVCEGVVTWATTSTTAPPQDPTCPDGAWKIPGSGVCVDPGAIPPGGDPLFFRAGGEPVIGSFGIPASTPYIVGSITDKDGRTSDIRRCSRGSVLGLDNLCYAKQILPRRNKFRKHRAAKRPPMSAADATALGRIGTLREKVKTLAKDANMSCKLR